MTSERRRKESNPGNGFPRLIPLYFAVLGERAANQRHKVRLWFPIKVIGSCFVFKIAK